MWWPPVKIVTPYKFGVKIFLVCFSPFLSFFVLFNLQKFCLEDKSGILFGKLYSFGDPFWTMFLSRCSTCQKRKRKKREQKGKMSSRTVEMAINCKFWRSMALETQNRAQKLTHQFSKFSFSKFFVPRFWYGGSFG